MSNLSTVLIDKAIQRKKEYPVLDKIVSDGNFRKRLRKYDSNIHKGWSLQHCLTEGYTNPEDFSSLPWLKALEENLEALQNHQAIKKPSDLSSKLLNETDFQNTLAELALARFFQKNDWKVELERPFGIKGKDCDIFAEKDSKHWYIEVINLEPKDLSSDTQWVSAKPLSENDLLISKIIDKYKEKFEAALNNGWSELNFIAIDYTKNHQQTITAFTRNFSVEEWWNNVSEHLKNECPKLTGIIAYAYMPTDLIPYSVNTRFLDQWPLTSAILQP